jgi:hypothetical protein
MESYMPLDSNKRTYILEHTARKWRKPNASTAVEKLQHAVAHDKVSNRFLVPCELRDIIYKYIWNEELDFILQHHRAAVLII